MQHMQPWLPAAAATSGEKTAEHGQVAMSQADIDAAILAEAGGSMLLIQPFLSQKQHEPGWSWATAHHAFRQSWDCQQVAQDLSQFLAQLEPDVDRGLVLSV